MYIYIYIYKYIYIYYVYIHLEQGLLCGLGRVHARRVRDAARKQALLHPRLAALKTERKQRENTKG